MSTTIERTTTTVATPEKVSLYLVDFRNATPREAGSTVVYRGDRTAVQLASALDHL